MKYIEKLIQYFSYGDYKQEFLEYKVIQNNIRILILSGFLAVEQAFYGFFIREPGTIIQKIHYFSAFVMLTYFFIGLYLRSKKNKMLHQVFVLSIVIFGILIAVYRSFVVENTPYHLSTIFIAVIYGLAVIFYLNPLESFAVYLIGNAFIIYFFPLYHSYYFYTSYVEDSIVNCMIAWVISVINYKNFLRHFINQKIIERNNLELSRKNNQIEEMNGYLKDASLKDPLTGIFNRRKLNDVLNIAYHEALEKKLTFSIILLDIDKFKSINDEYGHKTGDIVLKEIGKIFIKNINWPYVVGRWGGEEFMIVCPCTDLGEAMQLSEKIRMSIEIHNFLPVGTTTASFGVSSYNKGDSIEDVIQRADEALYRAKNRGRNRVETAS